MKLIVQTLHDEDNLVVKLPSEPYRTKLVKLLEKCDKVCNGYVSVDIERPYKKRTTGEGSQNNKFYALVTEIAQETGNDIEDVKQGIKERALKRGYPYDVNPISKSIKPYSTTRINTVQMSMLIEECLQVCAELGINLEPEMVKEEPKEQAYQGDIF